MPLKPIATLASIIKGCIPSYLQHIEALIHPTVLSRAYPCSLTFNKKITFDKQIFENHKVLKTILYELPSEKHPATPL